MTKNNCVIGTLALSLVLFFMPNITQANNSTELRSTCFELLKENINESKIFPDEVTTELADLSYDSLAFSRYYDYLSSFFIDIDEPLFSWRIYSFGDQTDYIHPPYSPFPTNNVDSWDEPSKEYIIVEEYVTDESNTRNFLSCGLIQVEAEDVSQVTADDYLYDGSLISVIKKEDTYSAWYNSNISYDYNSIPFVTWNRLFIYPQDTQNDYFDRYTLTDAIPANEVDNLIEMVVGYGGTEESYASMQQFNLEAQALNDKFIAEEITQEELISALSELEVKDYMSIYEIDGNGKYVDTPENITNPLSPIDPSAKNSIFSMNTYYASIEATFPDFAKHLAIQGLVPYETVKTILADPDNSDYDMLWDTIFDPRLTIQYGKAKLNGEITDSNTITYLEDALEKIEVLSQNTTNIKPENLLTNKLTDEEKESFEKIILEEEPSTDSYLSLNTTHIIILIILIILTPTIVFTIGRRNRNQ